MANTVSGTVTLQIDMGVGTYGAELVITSTGKVAPPYVGETAIYGLSTITATISNAGEVLTDDVTGISLKGGGTIINAAGGLIIAQGTSSLDPTGILENNAITNDGISKIDNFGTIYGVRTAVFLNAGGYVTNHSSGVILATPANSAADGPNVGVYIRGFAGTIVNDGTINAANKGVDINNGGTVTNTNAGTITGSEYGVYIHGGGTVSNAGNIEGAGDDAVRVSGGGLVVNSGTLSTGAANAVDFAGSGNATLELAPSSVINGGVQGGTGINLLQLESGSSAGTIDSLGNYHGFNNILLNTDSHWTLGGSVPADSFITLSTGSELSLSDPTGFTGTIASFATGETIDLLGFAATSVHVSTDAVTLSSAASTIEVDFADNTLALGTLSDGHGGTDIMAMPCFAAGTRILRADGVLAPVEDLRIGDALELFDGTAAPICWIGWRTLDLRRHPRPAEVQPILITAGALGHGLPWRNLVVSPDHGMYLNGHLIPAKALLNGFTVRQLNLARVTYYHIELPDHAVIFGEGAAAESYLETGNRGAFENGGAVQTLHPDFAHALRLVKSCAPFAESGPVVEQIRAGILNRAAIATTDDPALAIGYESGGAIICSRAAVPGEIFADPRDRRRLGVKIARLEIAGATVRLDHPALTQGWHDPEPDGRWTDGHAVIPPSLVPHAAAIKIELAASMRYPIKPDVAASGSFCRAR